MATQGNPRCPQEARVCAHCGQVCEGDMLPADAYPAARELARIVSKDNEAFDVYLSFREGEAGFRWFVPGDALFTAAQSRCRVLADFPCFRNPQSGRKTGLYEVTEALASHIKGTRGPASRCADRAISAARSMILENRDLLRHSWLAYLKEREIDGPAAPPTADSIRSSVVDNFQTLSGLPGGRTALKELLRAVANQHNIGLSFSDRLPVPGQVTSWAAVSERLYSTDWAAFVAEAKGAYGLSAEEARLLNQNRADGTRLDGLGSRVVDVNRSGVRFDVYFGTDPETGERIGLSKHLHCNCSKTNQILSRLCWIAQRMYSRTAKGHPSGDDRAREFGNADDFCRRLAGAGMGALSEMAGVGATSRIPFEAPGRDGVVRVDGMGLVRGILFPMAVYLCGTPSKKLQQAVVSSGASLLLAAERYSDLFCCAEDPGELKREIANLRLAFTSFINAFRSVTFIAQNKRDKNSRMPTVLAVLRLNHRLRDSRAPFVVAGRLFLNIALECGLRSSEMAQLRRLGFSPPDDNLYYLFAKGEKGSGALHLIVCKNKTMSNGLKRVPLSAYLQELLELYCSQVLPRLGAKDGTMLFCLPSGAPLASRGKHNYNSAFIAKFRAEAEAALPGGTGLEDVACYTHLRSVFFNKADQRVNGLLLNSLIKAEAFHGAVAAGRGGRAGRKRGADRREKPPEQQAAAAAPDLVDNIVEELCKLNASSVSQMRYSYDEKINPSNESLALRYAKLRRFADALFDGGHEHHATAAAMRVEGEREAAPLDFEELVNEEVKSRVRGEPSGGD
jgi:hypothetical protein